MNTFPISRYKYQSALEIVCLLVVAFCLAAPIPSHAGKDFEQALSQAALERTTHTIRYDGSYRSISYPKGDVPEQTGVCTDVVIRSYRTLGIDLQKRVHEDMKAHFYSYPNNWGLKRTDTNIDHRRVPNLQVFFTRKGKALKVTQNSKDYQPGDLVTWKLNNNLPHIGIVVNRRSKDGKRPLIVHNIGLGPRLEDMLFDFKITGHYRYTGKESPSSRE
ncbi:MAG TPA: DUF1287 domain-containing protein [Anaerolineales bacterium]|jgi:uncharacterized protein YijF (DUF1287 family)